MGTRVSYPVEVKQKAVEMRLAGVPVERDHAGIRRRFRQGLDGIGLVLHIDSNSLLESNTLTEKVRSMLPN